MNAKRKTVADGLDTPLRIGLHIWGSEVCELYLIRHDSSASSYSGHWPTGFTPDAVAFIAEHCVCAYCERAVSAPLRRCKCGNPKGSDFVLGVTYPTHMDYSELKPILDREYARVKRRQRRARIEASEGRSDRSVYPEMLAVQEHRCYYCATSLLDSQGKSVYHADHYLSLSQGGSDSFENIVLACPSCNRRKGSLYGDTFYQKVRRTLDRDTAAILKRVRRELRNWRARQARKSEKIPR